MTTTLSHERIRAHKEARRVRLRAYRYALHRRFGSNVGQSVYDAERAGELDDKTKKELKAQPNPARAPKYLPCAVTGGQMRRRALGIEKKA